MQMHLTIAVFFAVTVLIAFFEDYLKEIHKFSILAVYVAFMVLLATTKSIPNTSDALDYEHIFYNNDDPLLVIATEPTFIQLSRIVLALGGSIVTVFFIYAIITIPAKMKMLYTMTPFVFTALVIYIPVYFEVHDMIQIRAAAAATFLFFFIYYITQKRHFIATAMLICAFLFHYSSIVFLPFLFIGNRQLSKTGRIIVASLVPFCFMMYLLKLDWFSLIPEPLWWGKLAIYKESTEKGEWMELSPLYKNLYYMAKCVVLYLCLYYYDTIVKNNPYAPIIINLFAISICFLSSMATIPVIGSRISDLFGIIDCIAFTFCFYIITPRYIVRAGVTIAGLYMLLYNMIYSEYFR